MVLDQPESKQRKEINKSFLKWAGGKSKSLPIILSVIRDVCKDDINKVIEPFAGSMVFSLNVSSVQCIVNDVNTDLINLYKCLQGEGTAFIDDAKKFFDGSYNNESSFYELRSLFNKTDDIRLRSMLFIYLNRHAFNGLCRYNSSGGFNVPYGRYKVASFPESALMSFCATAHRFAFECGDFQSVIECNGDADVVYADPPYTPINDTAYFTSYYKGDFGPNEHKKLVQLAENSKGLFMISNNRTEYTEDLYKNADEIVGIDVNRSIGANASTRKQAKEILAIYYKGFKS